MPSTYTTNLGIEKIATGEQSGTWGTTTNTNFDLIDTAVNGIVSITLSSAGNSGSPNDLPITDGTASNGRNKFIEFTDGGDLGATAYVQLTPNDAEKIVHIRNSLSGSRSIIIFQGTYNASNDFEIPNGADVTLKFDGGGSGATVTDVNADLTVTGLTATSTVSFSGATIDNLGTVTTVDINGGTIDGTVIGGSSAAAGTFTTFTSTGIDDNATSTAITIDSDGDVGIGLASPLFQATDRTAVTINGTTSSNLVFGVGGSANTYLLADAAGFTVGNTSATLPTMFYTNSAERMRIASNGRVGIGETSPNSLVHLKTSGTTDLTLESTGASGREWLLGSRTDGALNFYDVTGSSEAMRIDASGNVGIGTTSPSYKLDVDVGAPGSSDQLLGRFSSQAGTRSIAFVWDDSASTLGIGTQTNHAMAFHINGSSAEKMRIDTSGNVGIGTTSPQYDLSFGTGYFGLNYSTGKIALYQANSTSHSTAVESLGSVEISSSITGSGSGAIKFNTYGSERMRIDASGNVGIATTSPSTKLEVSGDSSGVTNNITTYNANTGASAEAAIDWALERTGSAAKIRAARISAGKEQTWTTTGSTVDGYLRFLTVKDESLGEAMRITSAGNTLMGLTSDYYSAKLAVGQSGGNPAIACRTTNSSGTVALVLFTDGNSQDCGSIDVNTTANTTNYGTSSDQRLKENIVDAPAGNIDDVRVRSFDWKSSGHHQTYGLVAQELVDVAPEAVSQGQKEEDTWKVDYSKLVPMMIKEIQDLKAEVAALKGA